MKSFRGNPNNEILKAVKMAGNNIEKIFVISFLFSRTHVRRWPSKIEGRVRDG